MRKIKYIAVAGALAALALPAVAFADQPTALVWKHNTSCLLYTSDAADE